MINLLLKNKRKLDVIVLLVDYVSLFDRVDEYFSKHW